VKILRSEISTPPIKLNPGGKILAGIMTSRVKIKNFRSVIKLAGQITDNMIKEGNNINGMQLAVR
jgi:hypothetical protein